MDSRGNIYPNPTEKEIKEKDLIIIEDELAAVEAMSLEERQKLFQERKGTATENENRAALDSRGMRRVLSYLKKKQERKANGVWGKPYFNKAKNKDN